MKQSSTHYFAIIVAAGLGKRLNLGRPKQYGLVQGKPILAYTLDCILHYPLFEKCILVLHEQDQYWKSFVIEHPKLMVVQGGAERHHSVLQGLLALQSYAHAQDWVVVHDGVRPMLQHSDLDKLIKEVGDDPVGGLLGHPLSATLKQVSHEPRVIATLDRTAYWQALTPQLFRYHWLNQALTQAIRQHDTITDEASAIEQLGHFPKMIEGRSDNLKITYPADFELFKRWVLGGQHTFTKK
jgi:2-C-methyl-D-erythritol 4-phosphate cytidylyltransferase